MTTVPQPNDPANGYTAKYDAWNRLMSLVNNDTDNNSAAYEYDGLHRRIVRRENTNDQGGSTLDSVTHFYYNENWQCLEERVGSSTSADRQYVWHPYYIDALAVSYRDANSSSSDGAEEDNFYLHDANFNVTAAVNSSGSVVERYAYTPYGEVTVLHGAVDADGSVTEWTEDTGGSDIGNEFLYTGRRLDPETGLYQYRHRYYHAQLGRFINRDPLSYVGGINLYSAYFAPNGRDPFGLADDIEDIEDLCFDKPCSECLENRQLQRRFQRLKRCNVNVYCSPNCGAGGGGALGGITYVSGGYIHICLNSTQLKGCPAVFEMLTHEAVHAEQYIDGNRKLCRQNDGPWQGPPPQVPPLAGAGNPNDEQCKKCIDAEEEAYMAQAKVKFPNMPWLWDDFVSWGVCFSCSHVCKHMPKPCGPFTPPPQDIPPFQPY